jgi:hypothetical protein
LVQRFGRLNRSGEFGFNKQALHGFAPLAIVVGIEAPDPESKDFKNKDQKDKAGKEAEQKHLPYAKEKCDNAWTTLAGLNGDASPAALAEIKEAVSASIDRCPYSLQQHELLDFSTLTQISLSGSPTCHRLSEVLTRRPTSMWRGATGRVQTTGSVRIFPLIFSARSYARSLSAK